MKQEQLEREGIKVGDYYVVRRGKRIAVMVPGYTETLGNWNESTYAYEPVDYDPEIQLAFTDKQAEHVIGSLERLNAKRKEQDGISKRISEAQDKISELEDEIRDLKERQGEVFEEFKDYEIKLSGNGIQFGCTKVDAATLKALKKLLKKGKK